MSSDRELTRIVQSWLEEGVNVLPDRVLDDVLERVPVTPQRRPWWRAWRKRLVNRTMTYAVAGTVGVLVAAVALGVYLSRPAVGPVGSPTPSLSPTIAAATSTPTQQQPSPTLGPTQATTRHAPWIAFELSDGYFGSPNPLWAMRADGTGAGEIFAELSIAFNIAWSQDGKRVLLVTADVDGTSHVYLSEVTDDIGPFVDTGFGTGAETACLEKTTRPVPCQDYDFTFAPDGGRVAFWQRCTFTPGCGFVTILDLRDGTLTELSATLQQGPDARGISSPAWSPDGTQIALIIEEPWAKPADGSVPDSNLWLIDADGQNLHKIELTVRRVIAPQWSPDGKTIALVTDDYGNGAEVPSQQDIYTVSSDGANLQQLTTDGQSSWPEWTLSGQIRFRNGQMTDQSTRYSIMNADGSNLSELIDVGPLFEAVQPDGLSWFTGDLGRSFLWQPAESWFPDQ